MAITRKEATDLIVDHLNKVVRGYTANGDLMRTKLDAMSDAEFDQYIRGMKPRSEQKEGDVRTVIPFYLPNLAKEKVDIAHVIGLSKKLGRSMFQRIVMTDPYTGIEYLTPHEYLCLDTVVRRQAQTSYKKMSIPDVKQQVDDMTGQPTALSKGSRISSPESKFLDSRNLIETQRELVHVRGGAEEAYREFRKQLITKGQVELSSLRGLGVAKSTLILSNWLKGQHLGNNLMPNAGVPDDALPKELKEK